MDPALLIAEMGAARIGSNLLLLLLLVALSAAFSGSETVLFSLTRTQLEHAAASANPLRRIAAQLMQRPKQTLLTILLANTTVNVLLFAVSYVFFNRLAAELQAWWVSPASAVFSVLLVVVGGEVVPKVLAVRFAERVAPLTALLVRTVGYVAGPIARGIDLLIAEPFVRVVLGAGRRRSESELSTQELKALLELSRRRGEINRVEDDFLREIVDLGRLRVRDLMIPRVEIVAYDVNEPAEGLKALMRETRLKKIPVYDESIDDIVGLIYAKVLFLNPDKPLRALVAPVRFLPDLATCEHLLQHFRETRTQLAIAVDEYGGVAGLVALEDVLEVIVGDISGPEEAPREPEIEQLSEFEYSVSGSLDVRYWAEMFYLPPQFNHVATVGGLVTAELGRPAHVGDVVRIGNLEVTVTKVQGRRIDRLRVRWRSRAEAAP